MHILIACQFPVPKAQSLPKKVPQTQKLNSKISHYLAEVRKDGTKTIICLVVFWVTMPLSCREEGDRLQTFCEK